MNAEFIWNDVVALRAKGPLVHNITNYVVMNNTANALLALGASPVMAHAVEEVEEMVGVAAAVGGALVVNIGTLSGLWIDAMHRAMAAAAKAGLPIVLDPVGAGATAYRTQTCRALLQTARPAVIRGNASEIMALLDASVQTKGVDSSAGSDAAAEPARRLASKLGCVVSLSGETDFVTDGQAGHRGSNGHVLMTRVTGLGCTASALTGAFLAVRADPLVAAAHAMAVLGIAGELAAEKAEGPGTLQLHLYDALYTLTRDEIERRLRWT